MIDRSLLTRLVVVLVVAAATVGAVAPAAGAKAVKNSDLDRSAERVSCEARQGVYVEAAVATGSVSSCTYDGGVEACSYDSTGASAGQSKNCTRISGRSAGAVATQLSTLIATVDALERGSEPPPGGSDIGNGGAIAVGKTKIYVKPGTPFHLNKPEFSCDAKGGTYSSSANGSSDCVYGSGSHTHVMVCAAPTGKDDKNCVIFRTTGPKPLMTVLVHLLAQVDALSPDSAPSAPSRSGGGSRPTTTTTSTTKPKGSSTTSSTSSTSTSTSTTTSTTKPPVFT